MKRKVCFILLCLSLLAVGCGNEMQLSAEDTETTEEVADSTIEEIAEEVTDSTIEEPTEEVVNSINEQTVVDQNDVDAEEESDSSSLKWGEMPYTKEIEDLLLKNAGEDYLIQYDCTNNSYTLYDFDSEGRSATELFLEVHDTREEAEKQYNMILSFYPGIYVEIVGNNVAYRMSTEITYSDEITKQSMVFYMEAGKHCVKRLGRYNEDFYYYVSIPVTQEFIDKYTKY